MVKKLSITIGSWGGYYGEIDGVPFNRKGICLDQMDLLQEMLASIDIEVETNGEYTHRGEVVNWSKSNFDGKKKVA